MRTRLRSLRALRLNYRWRAVLAWLKTPRHVPTPAWQHRDPLMGEAAPCPRCGRTPLRGYQRILTEPERVIAEQEAIAEGVFV